MVFAALLQRGLPVPVGCCWNGAVVVKMRAFTDRIPDAADVSAAAAAGFFGTTTAPATPTTLGPVAFRRPMTELGGGACDESECTTFCRDLYDRGFQRIYVNPKVVGRTMPASCLALPCPKSLIYI